jgi:DnaJ-domain-containing protein 1
VVIHAGDPFAILGLERRFDLTAPEIAAAYLRTVSRLHPDRARDAVERDEMVRASAAAGEARQRLMDESSRAEVLLEHLGARHLLRASPSPAFLMETLELRDSIEEALASGDATALEAAARTVSGLRGAALADLSTGLGSPVPASGAGTDVGRAADAWVRLRYLERMRARLAGDA